MKSIAALLAITLLFGPAWAVSRRPVESMTPENQVPFSFLPPKDSIYSGATLKPIQDLSEVHALSDTIVSVPTTPLRPLAPCQIQGINVRQAKGLTAEIARFMSSQQLAQSTTIQLQVSENRKLQAFNALLEAALREQGFAVSRVAVPGAVPLRYQVIRVKQEILLRLMMNQTEISRLYRDDLVALTPFTLLNKEGQQ